MVKGKKKGKTEERLLTLNNNIIRTIIAAAIRTGTGVNNYRTLFAGFF